MNRKTIIAAMTRTAEESTDQGDFSIGNMLNDLALRIAMSKPGQDRVRVIECVVAYANELDDAGRHDDAEQLTILASRLSEANFDFEPVKHDITADDAEEKAMEAMHNMRNEAHDHLAQHYGNMSEDELSHVHGFLDATSAHDDLQDEYLQNKLTGK